MKCLLYARVSTEEQADLSIPAQIQAMREFAAQRGWTILEEFLEPGISARTTQRPALQSLLARVRKNDPPAEVVLVHKIDRLARNVYDHATIRALLQQHQIRLASVVENVDDTIPGQLVENIMASIAQFYSANLGEEVKKGMRQKIRNGGWPHMPPLGYRLVQHAGAKSTIEIHPTAGPMVRLAFELYVTGRWGVRALSDHLKREGLRGRTGKVLAQSNVRKMLANPFYAGRLRWEGKVSSGKHDPLIPEGLFNEVQKVIAGRRSDPKAPLKGTAFPLKVVAVCASCRGSMTAEMHGVWGYYRCCRRMANKDSCPSRMTNAKVAHDGLVDICGKLTIDEVLATDIQRRADALIEQRVQNAREALAGLRDKHRSLSLRHQQLTESFLAGQVSPATFEDLVRTLNSERGRVSEAIRNRQGTTDVLRARVRQLLVDASDIWTLFGRLPPVRQLELLKAVFESIVLGPSGVMGYVLREPFASIFDQAVPTSLGLAPSQIAAKCVASATATSDQTNSAVSP